MASEFRIQFNLLAILSSNYAPTETPQSSK